MEHGKEKDVSVFDFLYVNRGRLTSLLSQLSDDGVSTSIKRVSSRSGTSTGGMKVSTLVASGEGSIVDQATEALEQQFDSSGLVAINALTVLEESGLMHRGLRASLGQIVLFSGSILLQDISTVKRIWAPVMQLLASEEKAARKKGGHVASVGHSQDTLRAAGGILKELPDYVQILVSSGDDFAWGIIGNDDPAFDPAMIGLKHGPMVQGEWHVIGILDALPDEPEELPTGAGISILGNLSAIVQQLRVVMGRPNIAYGVTPLAIFREHPRSTRDLASDTASD